MDKVVGRWRGGGGGDVTTGAILLFYGCRQVFAAQERLSVHPTHTDAGLPLRR